MTGKASVPIIIAEHIVQESKKSKMLCKHHTLHHTSSEPKKEKNKLVPGKGPKTKERKGGGGGFESDQQRCKNKETRPHRDTEPVHEHSITSTLHSMAPGT